MNIEIECRCGTVARFSREEIEAGQAHCPSCGLHVVADGEGHRGDAQSPPADSGASFDGDEQSSGGEFPARVPPPLPEGMRRYRGPLPTRPEHLLRIRQGTCYAALRLAINFIAGLMVLAIMVPSLALLLAAVEPAPGDAAMGGMAIVTTVAVAALGVLLVAAGWQAAVLLIDVADTLVEWHRCESQGERRRP